MADYDNLDGVLSPFLRRRRLRAARPFIRGRVLDYGCGTGLLAEAPGLEDYVGVDIDDQVLRSAALRFPRWRFIQPDALGTLGDERFDTIAALAVIEHLPDPVFFLRQMRKLLARGGSIVITTPCPTLDWAHGLGGRLGIFAAGSHQEHQSLMGRADIEAGAAASGLKVARYRRFLFGANQLAVLSAAGV